MRAWKAGQRNNLRSKINRTGKFIHRMNMWTSARLTVAKIVQLRAPFRWMNAASTYNYGLFIIWFYRINNWNIGKFLHEERFNQPRPQGPLVFQYGAGGISENQKTRGTRLEFNYSDPRDGCFGKTTWSPWRHVKTIGYPCLLCAMTHDRWSRPNKAVCWLKILTELSKQ